jgi:phosphoribosyl 1,2-cyclic phosphodiesterase
MIKFCSLFSGSSGNCLLVSDDKTSILIDAGMSGRSIIDAIKSIGCDPSSIDAICITHEHSDHIKGAGILSRMLDVPVFANEKTWNAMENDLGKISEINKRYFNTGENFSVGDILIHPFSIPHDASEPVGFNFFVGNKKITVATDIGHANKELFDKMIGSDFMLLESNHDIEMVRMGSYPWQLKQRILGENGHLSNVMAGKLIARLVENGTNRFMLGHLSKENNFPQLAYETVKNVLESKGIKTGVDAMIEVAHRGVIGDVICIG